MNVYSYLMKGKIARLWIPDVMTETLFTKCWQCLLKSSRTVPKKLTWPFLSCKISASCKILQVFAQMTGPNYESSRRKSNFSVLGQKSSTWQNYLKLQQDNNCNSRCPGLNRICSFVPVHTNMITLRIQWPLSATTV